MPSQDCATGACGGAAHRSTSAPHTHVLVYICSNVGGGVYMFVVGCWACHKLAVLWPFGCQGLYRVVLAQPQQAYTPQNFLHFLFWGVFVGLNWHLTSGLPNGTLGVAGWGRGGGGRNGVLWHLGRASVGRRMNTQILLQYFCAPPLQTLVEPRFNFCLHFLGHPFLYPCVFLPPPPNYLPPRTQG